MTVFVAVPSRHGTLYERGYAIQVIASVSLRAGSTSARRPPEEQAGVDATRGGGDPHEREQLPVHPVRA
jgi:hypothetical protein